MTKFYNTGELQTMKKASKIEEMISVFEPFPLMEKTAFEEFYVNTYEARGNDAVKRMAYGLKYSLNNNMKILFMGHRGSGKSTELFLLKNEICDKFEIISFFIEDEVDADSMTYIDFIFAIMSQIVKFVDNRKDMSFLNEDIDALYRYWQEEKIIEDTEYGTDEIKTEFSAKLSFLKRIVLEGGGILKTGSESKIIIRNKIEPKVGYLIQLINQLIVKINDKLDGRQLIIIIEDLDKLSMEVANELFIKYRKVILSINARMILTFPIFMAYDSQYNMIKEDVDMCQMLSIIKVKKQDKEPFKEGIKKLKEIVYKRANEDLIIKDALEFAVIKSGGAIRDLFQLLRDAAYEALVDSRKVVEVVDVKKAYIKMKSEYERLIRTENDVDKLKLIYHDPRPLTTDETVMSLLLRGLIIEYNGERWCGIHPVVEDFLREKGEISDKEKDEILDKKKGDILDEEK